MIVGPLGDGKVILKEVETRFGKWEKQEAPKIENAAMPPAARSLSS